MCIRDRFSRLLYGTRISIMIGLVPTLISMTIGTILGLAGGFYGGKIDFVIMRFADIVLAFPSLLLAMVVMYTLGASLINIFIALSIVQWAGTARVIRSQTLSLKEKEFVEAARSLGVRKWIIMLRHIPVSYTHLDVYKRQEGSSRRVVKSMTVSSFLSIKNKWFNCKDVWTILFYHLWTNRAMMKDKEGGEK